jgi:two-component system response regulator MprA
LVIELLSDSGYKVLGAHDGQEAWEVLQSTPVDMTVLDLIMPRVDGNQLTRKIRSQPHLHEMPILMLSVRALIDDQLCAFESGIDDYLTKPFTENMLLARVRVLERRLPA